MAGEDRRLAGGATFIDFQTEPSRYKHWKLAVDGDVATLTMDVDENGGLFEGYLLKLIPTISASTSNSPTWCSGCASSTPR